MILDSPVRAELCILNVYSTGGHFEFHMDIPRSSEKFKSLVACLPSEFTGENTADSTSGTPGHV